MATKKANTTKTKSNKPKSIEVEAALSRQQISEMAVEDYQLLKRDPWKVANPTPGFNYTFAEREEMRVQDLKFQGFEIAPPEDAPVESPLTLQTSPDSLPPAPPGHILMRIPTKLKAARDEAKTRISKANEQTIAERSKEYIRMLNRRGMRGDVKLDDDNVDERVDLNF